MGKLYNGTTVLEGSSDSTVIPIFYPFIPELCSITLETYYSRKYAGILASALDIGTWSAWHIKCTLPRVLCVLRIQHFICHTALAPMS